MIRGGGALEPLVSVSAGDMLGTAAGAVFNEPRTHRYLLERHWLPGPVVTWIMLNPSTAGAVADDPTIRRCARLARREGCGGMRVVNLYALRATDPRELRRHPDPIGSRNDQFIEEQTRDSLVVAAWGAHGALNDRGHEVGRRLAAAGIHLHCLGVTSAGHPRHPLYVRGDAPLVPWQVPLEAFGLEADAERKARSA
jgi:hypothetical protein